MKIRLTTIALALAADRVLQIGQDLVVGEDIPGDLAQMRLDAGTAEIVPDGPALPPDLAAAIADYQRCAHAALMAGVSLIALAEQGDDAAAHAVARAFVDQVETTMEVMGPDVRARQQALFARADLAFELVDQEDDEFSGIAQSEARLAHTQEVAGSSPAPAPNHSEETNDAPAASEEAALQSAGLSDALRNSASADDAATGEQAASNDEPPPAGGAQVEAAEAPASAPKPKRPAKAQPAADPGGGA